MGMVLTERVGTRKLYGRPEFESRLGTPRGGPLPSGCNEDNKSGSGSVPPNLKKKKDN